MEKIIQNPVPGLDAIGLGVDIVLLGAKETWHIIAPRVWRHWQWCRPHFGVGWLGADLHNFDAIIGGG